jgi:hypothetical protein
MNPLSCATDIYSNMRSWKDRTVLSILLDESCRERWVECDFSQIRLCKLWKQLIIAYILQLGLWTMPHRLEEFYNLTMLLEETRSRLFCFKRVSGLSNSWEKLHRHRWLLSWEDLINWSYSLLFYTFVTVFQIMQALSSLVEMSYWFKN